MLLQPINLYTIFVNLCNFTFVWHNFILTEIIKVCQYLNLHYPKNKEQSRNSIVSSSKNKY